MADNIFQRKITPVVPKTLSNERIFVYVPDATAEQAGVASYNLNEFTLDRSENNKVSIIWPYANSEGNVGLIGVDTEDNYLEVDDSTHLLSFKVSELNSNIDSKIRTHNTSEEAHNDIRESLRAAVDRITIVEGVASTARTEAERINLVEGSNGTFTFTNYAGVQTTLQGGYLPDNTTIELNGSNQLVAKALNDGTTTITATTILGFDSRITTAEGNANNALLRVNTIYNKIPAATWNEGNELADKNWTNSTVSTNTATFRGTYNLVSDLNLGIDATEQQIAAALASAISTVTNNDYCYARQPNCSLSLKLTAMISRLYFFSR